MALSDTELIERALSGDTQAARALADRLIPVIQARVARSLMRRAPARKRNARQEVEDMTQEVLLEIFDDRGRALRSWKRERGLTLDSFIGLIAERHVATLMRSGRRSPWTEDPTDSEELAEIASEASSPEQVLAAREMSARLLDRIRECTSVLGLRLFYLLIIEEKSTEEVSKSTGLGRGAIYVWKNRLRSSVRRVAGDLAREGERR